MIYSYKKKAIFFFFGRYDILYKDEIIESVFTTERNVKHLVKLLNKAAMYQLPSIVETLAYMRNLEFDSEDEYLLFVIDSVFKFISFYQLKK